MFFHGLKTKIAFILVMILATAMILIDFVMITSAQHILLKSEISKARLFIFAIENSLITLPESEGVTLNSVLEDSFDRMFAESGIHCAIVLDKHIKQIYFVGDCTEFQDKLYTLTQETMVSGKKKTISLGTTWGVFWKQKQNLIISSPLLKKNNIVAGASVVLQLEGIYKVLRNTQYILLIYILINTVVLTFIGLYRLSKVTVKPVYNLLKRTEDYREMEELDMLLSGKSENEFNQLSKALNRMLKQISDDKQELELTVRSLEASNTELKQAQKEIIRAEKLASVGRLSAGIAHEIGNPIAIVIGYLELLKRKDIADEEKEEFIVRAENEINRINMIIRQLLDFSRPSDGEPKSVSVHEIINDIINVLKYQPVMSDIDVMLQLAAEKDTILSDPNQLRQVFLNLILNAADAVASNGNHSKGKIMITSEIAANNSEFNSEIYSPALKIMCIDNGPGIPEENIGNIFDPFYTTKEPGKGTGLGLSVSFMIVESIGGKIKASSEEGKGTTMQLYLPLLKT